MSSKKDWRFGILFNEVGQVTAVGLQSNWRRQRLCSLNFFPAQVLPSSKQKKQTKTIKETKYTKENEQNKTMRHK